MLGVSPVIQRNGIHFNRILKKDGWMIVQVCLRGKQGTGTIRSTAAYVHIRLTGSIAQGHLIAMDISIFSRIPGQRIKYLRNRLKAVDGSMGKDAGQLYRVGTVACAAVYDHGVRRQEFSEEEFWNIILVGRRFPAHSLLEEKSFLDGQFQGYLFKYVHALSKLLWRICE
jgi:hypothetical protein